MKRLLVIVLLAIAGCAPREAERCDVTITHELAFSAAHDEVTAQLLGPTCGEAVALYSVRQEDGHLIWAWAGSAAQLDDGADADAFLQRWASASVATTQTAPPFDRLAQGQTTLDRLTYEDLRARNLPMLCHLAGAGKEVCAFWEPAAGAAGLYFERNIEENAR